MPVTLDSILKSNTKTIIDTFLVFNDIVNIDANNSPTGFIGGSQRFGYANTLSDIDLFYFILDPLGKSIDILYRNGFERVESYQEHINMPNVSYGWHNKKLNVHLILITDWEYFEHLRDEHTKICDYLERSPEVLKFIKKLKSCSIVKGKFIYKSLLKMI